MNQDNLSIENAIIGNILVYPEQSRVALETLQEDDIADKKNQIVFHALKEIYADFLKNSTDKKFTIDHATILDFLEANKLKKAAGGEGYLDLLEAAAIGNSSLETYIRKQKNSSLVRKCFLSFEELQKMYEEKAIDNSSFLSQIESKIISITKQREVTDFYKIDDALEQMVIEFSKPNQVINLGYNELDRLSGGLQPGYLCILAARPSVGKTALALNFALNVAMKGRTVGIFSLEMDSKLIAMRLLQNQTSLDGSAIHYALENKDSNEKDIIDNRKLISSGIEQLKKLPIFIDDTAGQKLGDILAKTRKLKAARPDLGLIVIDYIGLIVPDVQRKDGNRQQEVALISQSLKNLAKDLQIPVLALSQLSRGVDQRKTHNPELSDLRESGAIEQDADQVYLLYRPDYYRNKDQDKGTDKKDGAQEATEVPTPGDSDVEDSGISQVELDVAKNRNGRTGTVIFQFDKPHCRFEIPDYFLESLKNENN
ncbi:MAG TPA: hypothetical protein DCY93_03135 [Firmicutes bacterium]|nr:hypothetical protein [Bacillota bacterium]